MKQSLTMTVADTDALLENYVTIVQSTVHMFDVVGTPGVYIYIDLWDNGGDALAGTNVPTEISLADFYDVQFELRTPMDGPNVLYVIDPFQMTITPVPEPKSMLLLALGGAGIFFRRRAGM